MINNAHHAHSGRSQLVSPPTSIDPAWNIRTGHVDGHLNSLRSKDIAENREQLIQAGRQFEAHFISYLLKVMRETVPEGSIANKQGAYFYSFYDEEIGVRAAESGGIGIAKMVQEYADKHFALSPVKSSSSEE
ncbi:MAG: rod-binding protein [Nitrospira sp.]|nr:rod-binding protein [Nitrospira sp.]